MFICNHCPFVKHVSQELSALAKKYTALGVSIYGINSNDIVNYPDDRPELMAVEKREQGYVFPYLFDETQEVAKKYHAACTPDFFLFNGEKSLVYRGQLDGSRPGNSVPVTGNDLRNAIDAILNGTPVSSDQKPSIGCNIKWKI